MFTPRNCRLLITTNWPELVNKRIQSIETQLREVAFENQSGELKVRGLIGRRITYLEYDGRCRRVEDRFQFETSAGLAFEELQKLNAELKSEYYIFQARHISDTYAVLEQGLFLKIDTASYESSPGSARALLAKIITEQGRSSTLLRLQVRLPHEGAEPKLFQGGVQLSEVPFDPGQTGEGITGRLIAAKLKGVVVYRTSRHLNAEFPYEQEFQFLMKTKGNNGVREHAAQRLRLNGWIGDLAWRKLGPAEWIMDLKLDYDWWLLEEKPLSCLISETPENIPVLQMKAPLFIDRLQFRLNHRFSLGQTEVSGHDLKLTVTGQTERLTQNALMISADLLFEYYYINAVGDEAYRKVPLKYDHLIPLSEIQSRKEGMIIKTVSKLNFEPLKVNMALPQSLEALVAIEVNFYREEMFKIPESSSGTTTILARIFSGKQSFTIAGSQVLLLREQPLRIQKLSARLTEVKSIPKTGWQRLEGGVELTVAYQDQQARMVENTFFVHFQDSFIWELLRPNAEVELKCRLEHDTYATQGRRIRYEYLINCQAELFETRELQVTAVSTTAVSTTAVNTTAIGTTGATGTTTSTAPVANAGESYPAWISDNIMMERKWPRLIFGGEVPLPVTRMGKPLELARSSFQLNNARCTRLAEATLIEGNLLGIIEYWDNDGYLRNEPINLAFWSLRSREGEIKTKATGYLPKLVQVSCALNKTGWWGKSVVKIEWELSFIPGTGDTEPAGFIQTRSAGT